MLIRDAVKTYRRGKVLLHFLNDPDTPLIVEVENKGTATYNCAVGTGDCDGHELTSKQIEWLDSHVDECEAWYEQKRVLS